jgi:hypothetical protein
MKPCSWCLFEAIERLFEKTHMIWKCGVNETRWLSHKDLFLKVSMKKCVIDI